MGKAWRLVWIGFASSAVVLVLAIWTRAPGFFFLSGAFFGQAMTGRRFAQFIDRLKEPPCP